MEGLKPPRTLKFYQLTKLSISGSLYISPAGTGSSTIGSGVFRTLEEAEQTRTMEILRDKDNTGTYHVFELEFPNPAYRE
jgi:hypothetical protein